MATTTLAPTPMTFIFNDAQYAFQTLRTVAATNGGAADISECLVTARAIKEGDDQSWHREWTNLAKRLEAHARLSKKNGHLVSARSAFLRAANYYRTAEFFLHATPNDPRLLTTWKKSRDCFREAAKLFSHPIHEVRIPFEKTSLPGYFCLAALDNAPKPLLIIQTGFDGTAEELYYQVAHAALARNYHCLLFEGPGQGEMIREQKIPFRANWETVIAPVVDFALKQKQVNKNRIALVGISFGGYLVPRALAFEQRIKVGIVNGGVYDFHQVCTRGMQELQELDSPRACQEIDRAIWHEMQTNPTLRWAFGNGMFTFGASTPSAWLKMTRPYHLREVAKNIRANMLVVDSDHDEDMPGQSKQLYNALRSPKEFLPFTAQEGAGEHCQIGAYALSNERILNWLDGNL